MGIIIQQTEGQSELQKQINANLKAKATARGKQEGGPKGGYHDAPDGVEDAAYMRGTKKTTTLAPAWAVVFILTLVVFAYVIYKVSQ